MQDNLRLARNKLQQAAERAKFSADKKRSRRVFNEGDRVFFLFLDEFAQKLMQKYEIMQWNQI